METGASGNNKTVVFVKPHHPYLARQPHGSHTRTIDAGYYYCHVNIFKSFSLLRTPCPSIRISPEKRTPQRAQPNQSPSPLAPSVSTSTIPLPLPLLRAPNRPTCQTVLLQSLFSAQSWINTDGVPRILRSSACGSPSCLVTRDLPCLTTTTSTRLSLETSP